MGGYWSRPTTRPQGTRKVWKSRCEYYSKERKMCTRQKMWSYYNCRKTCGMCGSNGCFDARPERKYTRMAYKHKTYKTRCAYEKASGRCKHSHYKRHCKKTCTGS